MAKTAGKFSIEINGKLIAFTKIGETYKTVDTPSGCTTRKVVEWEACEDDPEFGKILTTVLVFPRANRARIVEEYDLVKDGSRGGSMGIIY
jgi:hypothetical protein